MYAEPGPLYFVPADPDSLHADRSPYSFQPADSSLSSGPAGAAAGLSSQDFVITEHTYQMCSECPTFSIPIPVPRSAGLQLDPSAPVNPYSLDPAWQYQGQPDQVSVLQRLAELLQPALDTARQSVSGLLSPAPAPGFQDRLSEVEAGGRSDLSPLVVAGMAAVGLGVATLVSSGVQIMQAGAAGRNFLDSEYTEPSTDPTANLVDYDPTDMLCLPRTYCEQLKRQKWLLAEWPGLRWAGAAAADLFWERESVTQRGQDSWCNLRECVFSLLR